MSFVKYNSLYISMISHVYLYINLNCFAVFFLYVELAERHSVVNYRYLQRVNCLFAYVSEVKVRSIID